MSAPPVLLRKNRPNDDLRSPDVAMELAAACGALLALLGLGDLVLAAYPFAWHELGWEFAATVVTSPSLRLFAAGLIVLILAGVHAGAARWIRVAGWVAVVAGIVLLLGTLLFVGHAPTWHAGATDPIPAPTLRAVARTVFLGTGFGCVLLGVGIFGLGHLHARRKQNA